MANFESYKTDDGRKRYLATVRIKGFKKQSKAFDSQRDAKEWAEATEKELRALRDRGGAKAEVGTLNVRRLIDLFRADTEVQSLRYFPELEFLLAAWADAWGGTRVRSFGRIQIEGFRDTLLTRKRNGRPLSKSRVNRYLSAMRPRVELGHHEGIRADVAAVAG